MIVAGAFGAIVVGITMVALSPGCYLARSRLSKRDGAAAVDPW